MLSYQDTARLCRDTALLLRSGIHLADGFYLLAQEAPCPQQQPLQAIAVALDRGIPLSEALEKSGMVPLSVFRLVRIGEETGRLEESLVALAEHFEEQERTRHRIRSAVAYPTMLFCLMILVLAVLLVKVLPVFERVYASLGVQMTGVAGWMLYLGQLVKAMLPVICGLLCLLVMGLLAYRWCSPFRLWMDGNLQKHFGDCGLAQKFNNARFAQGLSMGLSSGLYLETAAELAESLLEHIPAAKARCSVCKKALSEGASIREAMVRGRFLSPAQSRMLTLGIRSGSADQVMQTIAGQLLEEAEAQLDRAVSRIEPGLVLTASLLVGAILLAVMLPLMDILSVLG